MHLLRVSRLAGAGHRSGKARWRRAAVMTMAAALPVTAIAAVAAPASAAGGYTVTATIGGFNYPIGVAVDPVTHTAYVTNDAGDAVSVIDEATDTVTANIRVACMPFGVAADPATGTVYETSQHTASVIDEATGTVTGTIGADQDPLGVAVDPVTHTAYVTNDDGTVSVIDEATDTVTATIGVGKDPIGVAVDPVTHTVYVANDEGNTVSVISEATDTVTATIPFSGYPGGVAVDPATGTVYVTSGDDNTVSVINEATGTVTATVGVGSGPLGVAVDPATGTVYVANYNDDTVSVIDEATDTVAATVGVGLNPRGIAVDPTTHTAYVTNTNDGTVSVISADGFQAPAIWSENRAAFRHGKDHSFTVQASGLPVPSVTEAGKLPPGVRFTAGAKGTAVIAGTPAASTKGKTFIITLTARNGDGKAATQRFTLRVSLGESGEDPAEASQKSAIVRQRRLGPRTPPAQPPDRTATVQCSDVRALCTTREFENQRPACGGRVAPFRPCCS